MPNASLNELVLDIVASDPWDFVGPDGSNIFGSVPAKRRTAAVQTEFPWLLDFGDRLTPYRFFAMRLTIDLVDGLQRGESVDCSLVSLPDEQAVPEDRRGGRAAHCTARLA